jgi:hypothetical protein
VALDTWQGYDRVRCYCFCAHTDLEIELIVTSFPQRWEQPKNDPLNVLDGIIEDMNAKTRPPIQSVYDLAMLISSRCCGMFDRHRMDNEQFQFLDMFESSIGHVVCSTQSISHRRRILISTDKSRN